MGLKAYRVVMAMSLRGMQNAKELNKAMDNAYPINPKNTLGCRLSILCLLGDQWRSLILPDSPPIDLPTYLPTYLRSVPLYIINNGAPVSDSGREN